MVVRVEKMVLELGLVVEVPGTERTEDLRLGLVARYLRSIILIWRLVTRR